MTAQPMEHTTYKTKREMVPKPGPRRREMGERAVFAGFSLLEPVVSQHEAARQELKSHIIDQDPAIDAIIEALDRTEVRSLYDNQPSATLAFLGPTGVGKSELAKRLAELQGGNLIKIDCSDYSHGHEVTKLVGSPPSYVGDKLVPLLAKQRVENGKAVVLFDEVEKGSTELYNLMLQIMEDGELTLSDGTVVNFREAMLVITSNLGAAEMSGALSPVSLGFGNKKTEVDKTKLEQIATSGFVEFFAPEFINRITKMVVFHPLTATGLSRVLEVKLEELNREYTRQDGIHLTLTDKTREHLVAEAAKQPHLGARPLVRALDREILTTFGRYSGAGYFPEGTRVKVFHRDELPEEHQPADGTLLVFSAQTDPNLRRYRPPQAITAASHPAFVQPSAPEVAPKQQQ